MTRKPAKAKGTRAGKAAPIRSSEIFILCDPNGEVLRARIQPKCSMDDYPRQLLEMGWTIRRIKVGPSTKHSVFRLPKALTKYHKKASRK
jgi:hypothetical protein